MADAVAVAAVAAAAAAAVAAAAAGTPPAGTTGTWPAAAPVGAAWRSSKSSIRKRGNKKETAANNMATLYRQFHFIPGTEI